MQFVGGSLLVHSFADNLYCASTLKSLRCDSTLKKYISQSGGRCLRDRWLKTGKKTHPHSYLFVEFGWTGPLRKHFFKNMTEMCHIFSWGDVYAFQQKAFSSGLFFFFLSVILFCFRKKKFRWSGFICNKTFLSTYQSWFSGKMFVYQHKMLNNFYYQISANAKDTSFGMRSFLVSVCSLM